jgi:hypothetical protein
LGDERILPSNEPNGQRGATSLENYRKGRLEFVLNFISKRDS